MIKALVVDDEKKSRESLRMLLDEFCDNVEVVGTAESISETLGIVKEKNPNLVFLDIRMRGESGFDLFKHFDEVNFEVVFTTAYSEYAIKAFKFSAIDYLLKPIDIEGLQEAVEKAEERIKSKEFPQKRIEALLQNLKPIESTNFKLALPTAKGLLFVKLSEILYCVGQNNYTEFYIKDKTKIIVSKTLKEYESMLSEHNFFRIHKSYLINLNEITEYIRGDGGYVIMNNNSSLDVAKRRKESFLRKISTLENKTN